LGHDTIIGRNDQYHDIGDGSTSSSHRCESCMTGRIEKGDAIVGRRWGCGDEG